MQHSFIWLVFAHYIGDFALQSEWMSRAKGQLQYIMIAHCVIWTACICVALQYTGGWSEQGHITNLIVGFLFLGHYIADKWKYDKETWIWIYPDQMWHLVQLIIVYVFV